MTDAISDILIKPHSSKEENYCKRYNVKLLRLNNGITILGIPCRKDFSSYVHVKFDFSEGAFKNKPGTVHLLEHFINKKARTIAEKNDLDIRAWTSQLEIGEEVLGVANPKVKNYGVWVVLDKIREALESPLRTVDEPERIMEIEKDVIRSEIKTERANHNFIVRDYLRKIVYSSINPLCDKPTVIGEGEDLEKIDINELEKVQEKVLIPRNLLISFYTEGEIAVTKSILNQLEKLFSDFPREQKPKNEIDKSLLGKIHTDFKPGTVHQLDTNLKNSIITTEYVWVLKNRFPDISYFALKTLRWVIASELFAYSRKKGWGYHTDVELWRPNDEIGILILRVDARKGFQKNYFQGIKKILTLISQASNAICELENTRQQATPLAVVDRLSWMVDEIKDYKAMIDADKIRGIMRKVKPKDINDLIKNLFEVKPVVVVTGDLS